MTHIEQIKDAIRQKQQEVWPTDTGEMKPATVPNNLEQGWLNALSWMEKFINSLPAEQPSEELEKAAKEYVKENCILPEDCNDGDNPYYEECTAAVFKDGAHWQKEQIMKNCLYNTEVMLHTKQNNKEYLTLANDKLPHIPVSCGLNVGDKVKILIIKEDEQ